MDSLEDLNSETIERLGKQGGFLLSTYHAELAKDPASHATGSSRSNVIALWHTIKQIYGKAVARDLISSRQKSPTTMELTALWDQHAYDLYELRGRIDVPADVVDGADVGVIQSGGGLDLTLKNGREFGDRGLRPREKTRDALSSLDSSNVKR
jgi:hypothetical protein